MKPDQTTLDSNSENRKIYHTPDFKQYGDLRDISKANYGGKVLDGYFGGMENPTS